MPIASIETMGPHLGAYQLTTPSGTKVVITSEQEARIAREALEWKLRQKLIEKQRLENTAVEAAISAVGNAVGFAAGGWILGRVLGVK